MKILLTSLMIVLVACQSKKNSESTGTIENTDYLVSLEGIGPVKTEISQAELEKTLDQKIMLSNPTDSVSGSWEDTATVRYKDAGLLLRFVRTYAYQDPDSFHMRVTAIHTESPVCKTEKGIGVGSGKTDILEAYPMNMIYMSPGYDNDSDTIYSKHLYTVTVRDGREGAQIIFFLRDQKVYALEVGSFHDDSE